MSKNTNEVKKIEEKKIELCDVLYITDKKIAFDFKGCGIICENKLNIKSDKIKVSYKSNIGCSDFDYQVIK